MRLGLDDLIDPRLLPLVAPTRDFYADRPARRGPAGPVELRAAREAAAAPAPCVPAPVEETAAVRGRSVPLRIHHPRDGEAAGVLLELHGGGFYLGSAAAGDVRNRQLADDLGVVVASVDYRLAPEHPWPAALEDCETAALWLAENAGRRFGTSNIALSGFSAGATLAVTTLLRLRERGIAAVEAAVLQFGTYDLSGKTPAGRRITEEYFLDAYAGSAPDRTHPDLSPVFAGLDELRRLPPLLMVVGAADILLEDNLAMAARLVAAGADVDLRVYPDAPHGFTGHPTPMARAALDDVEAWLSRRLGG